MADLLDLSERLRLPGSDQPLGRKYFLTLSPSVLNMTRVPRSWRICLLVRLIMPWRLRDIDESTFPVPVILKRFLAPDLVLILGIWLSLGRAQEKTRIGRTLAGFVSVPMSTSAATAALNQPGGGRAGL